MLEDQTLRRAALGFFVLTIGLGAAMRWDLALGSISALGLSFANLRHAHSHAGYYGVLTLGWWLVERREGLRIGRVIGSVYLLCALLATIGFAIGGYRPQTIVLSTAVATGWLAVGYARWRRRGTPSWLDVAPLGLVVSIALVPLIAVTASRNFALSRDIAHVFIGAVLFMVFLPAAWHALGLTRRVSVALWVPLATAACVRIVFAERATLISAVLALAFAALVAWSVITAPLSPATKLAWLAVPFAIAGALLVPELGGYTWRIGGLHYLLLGPVAAALFTGPTSLRVPYALTLGGMVLSIVTPERIWPSDPARLTAWASSAFAVVALARALVIARHRAPPPPAPDRSPRVGASRRRDR